MNRKQIEVLLVEDNPYDAKLTIRALKKGGLEKHLFTVKDGEEALEFVFCEGNYAYRKNEKPLKLILLDLKLPKINGLEVLEKIKSDQQSKSIPVVVLTSSDHDKDILKSYSLGANSYIVKPVELDNFIYTVEKIGLYFLELNKTLT